MDEVVCPGCLALQRRVAELEAHLERLTRLLEEALRAGKRQAAPFRKGLPKAKPQRPGRKAGDAHGTHGHRPPPPPEQVQQVLEAPLPGACPHCGGTIQPAEVVHQYQTEIPRQPIVRRLNIQVGCCQGCGQRVQGHHPLQTSDATGAAASQLGPDAQAAVVTLNKQAGLSHGKVADCLGTLFGIDLTRGACAQIVLRAADRLTPTYQDIQQATRAASQLAVDETGWRIGGHSAWLHVWVGARTTCYAIDPRAAPPSWSGSSARTGTAS